MHEQGSFANNAAFSNTSALFRPPFVKRFTLCYQTVVCLSCPVLSVCDVRTLWPNGWTDQDETWFAGKARSWPHCVRRGPRSPSPKGGRSHQIFGPCLLEPNGWMDEAGTWHGGRPEPRRLCVRWGPSFPKGGGAPPQFLAHVYCSQTPRWIKMVLGMEVGFGPGHVVLDGDPAPLPKKGAEPPPIFGPSSL